MKLHQAGGLLLAVTLAGPLTAQTRPLDPTQVSNLWPERELTPAETELRDAVVVLRDTLYAVDAAVERVERARRGDAANSLLRSAGYGLISECQRSERAAGRMETYATGLSTNDTLWGATALRNFRQSTVDLRAAMSSCNRDLNVLVAGNGPVDQERVMAAAQAARSAVRTHERAVRGLLRTLKIRLDPKGSTGKERG
jgi:hypothetical protein